MIFFFVWKGKGYLVILGMIATVLLAGIIGSAIGFKDATVQMYILEFIIALALFVPLWFYGKELNSKTMELIDKKTGKEFTIKNPHKAFWIPMQYWTIIWPVILLLIFAFGRG